MKVEQDERTGASSWNVVWGLDVAVVDSDVILAVERVPRVEKPRRVESG